MITKQRINNINKRLSKGGSNDFKLLLKFERWRYDIGDQDVVTLQEWSDYKARELKHSTDKKKTISDLNELENKIRAGNGFMELEFVSDMPEELRVKYGINGI